MWAGSKVLLAIRDDFVFSIIIKFVFNNYLDELIFSCQGRIKKKNIIKDWYNHCFHNVPTNRYSMRRFISAQVTL